MADRNRLIKKNRRDRENETGKSYQDFNSPSPNKGQGHTIDNNAALAATAKRYFEQAGRAHQIQYHLGQAVAIIPQLDGVFDLVYIDADKKNYKRYYELVFDRVRPGGFIIADNVLWGGKVLPGNEPSTDKRTQAIIDFNAHVHRDPRVANVLLPIRDGLMILRKQ